MKIRELKVSKSDKMSALALFKTLKALYPLENMTVLDAFARNGELTVKSYAKEVKRVDCWELGHEHGPALQSIANVGEVQLGCSYDTAQFYKKTGVGDYDMLVIDTPQGLHHDGEGNIRCEHFDFLFDHGLDLVAKEALIVLYVNKHPYNKDEHGSHGYDQYDEYDFARWMYRRTQFYGTPIITEGQAIETYRKKLFLEGVELQQVVTVPCFSDVLCYPDYAFRVALSIKKKWHRR